MKTYSFDATEFAKLEILLAEAVGFLHQDRSQTELHDFQARIYPILRSVYYDILGSKIGDNHRDAISDCDPDLRDEEISLERRVEILARIFET